MSPASPKVNQQITVDSDCSTNENLRAWDLDNDGSYDDGTGTTAKVTFATSGNHTIKLIVGRSGSSTFDTTSKVVNVAANAAPTASFTMSPASPLSSQPATFTSTSTDSDGTIKKVEWDWDANGTYDETLTAAPWSTSRAFTGTGTRTVKMRVTDDDGATAVASKTFTVQNRPPTADFSYAPTAPLGSQSVTFTGTATDPDGTINAWAWDLDNDGQFDDGSTQTVAHTFPVAGRYTVRMRVFDNNGAGVITTKTVTVGDHPPTALFTVDPGAPNAGDTVTLTSGSTDPDGTIASTAWDLNGDGVYDDGTGDSVTTVFGQAGTYVVGVLVTDDGGVTSSATQSVDVGGALPPAQTPSGGFDTSNPTTPPPPVVVPPTSTLKTLDPFPIIRIRGRTTTRGAKISLLSVKAPVGATATLRCYGKGCPKKAVSAKVKAKKGKATGTVDFTRARGDWKAGTVLRVLVSKKGLIGKYTQFTIRKNKAPARVDSCLMPGSGRPAKCPVA